MSNRDLIFFSKQIISARFRVLPTFGQVFEQWKSLENPLTDRKEISRVLMVKRDLPVILPFLGLTPLTLLATQPSGFIEISKTFGIGLSLTFTSLLVLPLGVLIFPKTCPSELSVLYEIPHLEAHRQSQHENLLSKILSTLEPHRKSLITKGLSTPHPNYISLNPQLGLSKLSPISKDLAKYYGIMLPRLFTLPRLYQYIDWILTDDYLLSTQRTILDKDELIKALSARGYVTKSMSLAQMDSCLKEHLKVSMGLRKKEFGIDEKVDLFVTLTMMALNKTAKL